MINFKNNFILNLEINILININLFELKNLIKIMINF